MYVSVPLSLSIHVYIYIYNTNDKPPLYSNIHMYVTEAKGPPVPAGGISSPDE